MTCFNCDRRAWILSVACLLSAGLSVRALADPPPDGAVLTDDQIANALKPAKTRSMSMRGLKRTQAAESMSGVNLNIPFEYNSSDLKPEATAQLAQLKSALTKDSLRNDRFLVAGHTDAKGNPQYNKQLSLRRAEAVKHFLVANGLDAGRLDTVGYGSEHPLAPDKADDPKNRRVEIRDLGEAPPGP
jgi:OmpA-OmpF porin, OOP family